MANKEKALALIGTFANGDLELARILIAPEYKQHNLAFGTGADAFIDAVAGLQKAPVKTTVNSIRAFEDGDYVWPFPDSYSSQSYRKYLQSLSTPTGTPEFVNRLSIRGTWMPKDYLTFLVQPSYTLIFNRNHVQGNTVHGFEIAAAISLKFINMKKNNQELN